MGSPLNPPFWGLHPVVGSPPLWGSPPLSSIIPFLPAVGVPSSARFGISPLWGRCPAPGSFPTPLLGFCSLSAVGSSLSPLWGPCPAVGSPFIPSCGVPSSLHFVIPPSYSSCGVLTPLQDPPLPPRGCPNLTLFQDPPLWGLQPTLGPPFTPPPPIRILSSPHCGIPPLPPCGVLAPLQDPPLSSCRVLASLWGSHPNPSMGFSPPPYLPCGGPILTPVQDPPLTPLWGLHPTLGSPLTLLWGPCPPVGVLSSPHSRIPPYSSCGVLTLGPPYWGPIPTPLQDLPLQAPIGSHLHPTL